MKMRRDGPTTVWRLSGLLSLVACVAAAPPEGSDDPCDHFYDALAAVPHVALTRSAGPFESIWDRETYEGCEVAFETNDSIRAGSVAPDLFADPGTSMYLAGWRMSDGIGADGAGSGIHGVERGSVLCVIRWEQPAYIDDDGSFVESGTLNMWIQCRDRESG